MATVLFVEDDPFVRLLGHLQLEQLDHSVIDAENAEVAIQVLLGDVCLDLVVTDYNLHGDMNGLQLANWIREQDPITPILIVTGHAEAELQANAAKIPILLKPFTFDQLASRIDDLL